MAHITGARKDAARESLGEEPDELVLPPQVFADLQNNMAKAQDGTLGPIAPIINIRGEAFCIANDTEFGLTTAVFTRSGARRSVCPGGTGGHDPRK
jgi:aldehyde dehydrogenase (NAD+)